MKYLSYTLLFGLCAVQLVGCSSSGDEELEPVSTQRLASVTTNKSDGEVILITSNYSSAGDLEGQVFTRDGDVFLSTTFEYTPDGRFARRSEDRDQDGIADFDSTYEYDDVLGLSRIYRHAANNDIDLVEVFAFENGLAVSRQVLDVVNVANSVMVDEAGGELKRQLNYEYENGRLSVKTNDTDADGLTDIRTDYSYSANGTIATSTITNISDVTTDVESFNYESGLCSMKADNSATGIFCVVTE